jgi:DNA-binding MurR/RpiR family transcriptional regulator
MGVKLERTIQEPESGMSRGKTGESRIGGREETVLQALRQRRALLTARESRAASYFSQHYPASGLGPMARFARAAGVSPQTVLRLLAKLDMGSWEDFQERLRAELASQRASPLGRWTANRGVVHGESDWLSAFGARIARNVAETFAGLSPVEFEAAARAIADPRRKILVVGGRFTQQLARLFGRHLQILRGNVEEIGSLSSTWPDRLIDVGRQTVVVAYDIRRYSQDVIGFGALAAEQGATVIAVTDDAGAPIVRHASLTMVGWVESDGTWDSIAALLAVTEALTARITELSGTKTAERLARLESLRQRLFQDDDGGG